MGQQLNAVTLTTMADHYTEKVEELDGLKVALFVTIK
jgi:hypothetical protein